MLLTPEIHKQTSFRRPRPTQVGGNSSSLLERPTAPKGPNKEVKSRQMGHGWKADENWTDWNPIEYGVEYGVIPCESTL